jgi:hypothetical protein
MPLFSRWLLGALAWAYLQGPAQAGLLLPVLQLMRPQLENRLTRLCVETASGGEPALEAKLQSPCQQLAKPTSQCLVEETDATGQSIAVLMEVVQGNFGTVSESVVKRCLAKMLGLPAETLKDVPLKDLAQSFNKARN